MRGNYDEQTQEAEAIFYFYFSKAGKITCNLKRSRDLGYNEIINIDAKAGWNKVYIHSTIPDGIRTQEWTTKNILTKEVRWTI